MGDLAKLVVRNVSALSTVTGTRVHWVYASCPDVDECLLGLHECHPNASCLNNHGSYECNCPRGFTGNGRISCERTYVIEPMDTFRSPSLVFLTIYCYLLFVAFL